MRARSPLTYLAAIAAVASIVCISQTAGAVVLVQTSDPGFYNHDIGNLLDLSNTGFDTCAEPFPVGNDCNTSYVTAPDLSAASSVLGNWLTDPLNLNSHWSNTQIAIPASWTPSTEVGVIYEFDTLAATNVVAQFAVDNGIYVWLDGTYLFGARAAGGPVQWEYSVGVGDLTAGTHFLQLLLEDHGASDGYGVLITADTFIPGPPPGGGSAPEPGTLLMFGLGFAGLLFAGRKTLGNLRV